MNFFSGALQRLKYCLRVSKDGEVADALGFTKSAFAERKRRGAFPETELRALAQARPDLRIDVAYILTGVTTDERRAAEAASPYREGVAESRRLAALDDGIALLENWRRCAPADRILINQLAARLATTSVEDK